MRVLVTLLSLASCVSLERPGATGSRLSARPLVARTTTALRTPSPVVLAAASPAPAPSASGLAVGWGVCGFLSILASAIKRLGPIALEPLKARDLSPLQWGVYVGTMVFFAYTEGYKAFQLKFSPMVVRRAMTLKEPSAGPLAVALAPFYSMGLFGATRKRKIVSWSVSSAVFVIVGIVKRLPYPWRSIVDAGVCVGLSWGGISIAAIYIKALFGNPPTIDPETPN